MGSSKFVAVAATLLLFVTNGLWALVAKHDPAQLVPSSPPTARKAAEPPEPAKPNAAVYFSPKGGCTQAVVDEIAKARKTICVMAYGLTSEPIAAALVAAVAEHGVKVVVVIDGGVLGSHGSKAEELHAGGVILLVDAEHAIAHNKVMIIDDATVITGSFNFSVAAEKANAENMLVLHDPPLVLAYLTNFVLHAEHSQPWSPAPSL